MKTSHDLTSVRKSIAISHAAEYAGRYEEGLIELLFFWNYLSPDKPPNLEGLSEELVAKLLLRCGVLYGFYGNSNKISQETSKDLITRALELFDQNDVENRTICANYLSYSYCRMGDLENAKVWVTTALDLYAKDEIYLQSIIAESNIAFSEAKYQENYDRLVLNRIRFEETRHRYYKGLFFNHLALVKKNLGLDGVLEDLKRAKRLFRQIFNRQLESTTLNTIASLEQKLGNYDEAEEYANQSIKLAEDLGDVRQKACVLDTLATIKIDRDDLERALEYSELAIKTHNKTESYADLILALKTKIRILYYQGWTEKMLALYSKTLKLAEKQTSSTIAGNLTKAVAELINERSFLTIEVESEKEGDSTFITVDMPERLRNADLNGVKITTDRLIDEGMEAGDYAVYRAADKPHNHDTYHAVKPRNNDIIVIQDLDGEVFVGKAHINFDILDLYFQGNIYQSFFEGEYTLLGRVIGYLTKPVNGKTELLELRRKGTS